jgi:hypothetical protein
MRRAFDAVRTGIALVGVVASLAAWAFVSKR